MRKQTLQFDSPLDALVAVAKRLSRYEAEAGMDSEDFYARYAKGEIGDGASAVDWANDYRHFLALRGDLDERLHEGRIGGSRITSKAWRLPSGPCAGSTWSPTRKNC